MKEYTLTLVTYVPFTQTVTVEANSQEDALLTFGEKVSIDSWVRDDSYVISDDDIEVEEISPEDESEDTDLDSE